MDIQTENNFYLKKLVFQAGKSWRVIFAEKEVVLAQTDRGILFETSPAEEPTMSVQLEEQTDDFSTYKQLCTHNNGEIGLSPCFPNKSILLNPKSNVKLLPKEAVEVLVAIPANLIVTSIGTRKEMELARIAAYRLSDAWFGDEHGEACYLLEADFIYDTDTANKAKEYIYCPLLISNLSDEILEIEKFIIRGAYLQLYLDENEALVSDQLSIKYRGKSLESILSVDEPNRHKWRNLRLIHEADVPFVEQLIMKSFMFIRSIY